MIAEITREDGDLIRVEGNTREEVVASAKETLANHNKRNVAKVTLDGEDITWDFEDFVKPCPCGAWGSPNKICLCSGAAIYRWRTSHNLHMYEI